MAETIVLQAKFNEFGAFEHALRALKESGEAHYEAYGPINLVEVEEFMPARGSLDHLLSGIGAVTGLIVFFLMCVLSSLIYRLITGGKPPISNVPFVIVGYEGTILLGAIFAFFGALFFARLTPRMPPESFNPKFIGDSFGIELRAEPGKVQELTSLLQENGAAEVKVIH